MFLTSIQKNPGLTCPGFFIIALLFNSNLLFGQYSLELQSSFYDNEYTSNSGDIHGTTMIDKGLELRFVWRLDTNTDVYIMGGLVSDQFSTTYNAYVVATQSEFLLAKGTFSTETLNYLFGIGAKFRHARQYSTLLPEIVAGFQLNARKGSQYSSGYFAINSPEGTAIESSFEEIRVRRINPYVVVGGRYELLQAYKVSIPVEFGKRIPLLKPEVYQEHSYRLATPQIRNARIERTGEATYFRVGLSVKL